MEQREIVSSDELLRRANAIKAMTQSEPFRWLIDAARRDCYRDFEKAKTPEDRELVHQRLLGVQGVEKQAQGIIDAGVRAAHAIEQQQKKDERAAEQQAKKEAQQK